jgi:hypothetical protein
VQWLSFSFAAIVSGALARKTYKAGQETRRRVQGRELAEQAERAAARAAGAIYRPK